MPVVIENPILDSPFEVPSPHWRITDEPVEGRRRKRLLHPVPPKEHGGQPTGHVLDGAGSMSI